MQTGGDLNLIGQFGVGFYSFADQQVFRYVWESKADGAFAISEDTYNEPIGRDPVDEYLMQYLMDYEDKKSQNVSKEGLKLGKDSKDKEVKESFKELTKWWKETLATENVDDVKISNRLADTPCVVVTSKILTRVVPEVETTSSQKEEEADNTATEEEQEDIKDELF
ncbi:hypothetical protein SSX86_024386 [Deinandra increscens subsp. villosa]|uniref:Uncharacterized protein n=1 Tax=Deinandra increscens subsp. villosa TaxID=3103831 RepID=A0AAP0CMZ5_9ASTR